MEKAEFSLYGFMMIDLLIMSELSTWPPPYNVASLFAVMLLFPELLIQEMLSTFAVRSFNLLLADIGSNVHHYTNVIHWWFEEHKTEYLPEVDEYVTKFMLVKKFFHYRFKSVGMVKVYHPLPYELTFSFDKIKAKFGGATITHNKGSRISILEMEPMIRDFRPKPEYKLYFSPGYQEILYGKTPIPRELKMKLEQYHLTIVEAKERIDVFRNRHELPAVASV